MDRPYIICHMMQSVDGRVACDMVDKISGDEYYDALESLDCPSHVEGKHSYQLHYCGFDEFKPNNPGGIDTEKWYVANKTDGYSISVDTRDVPDHAIVVGSPAKVIRYLEKEKFPND